MTKNAIVIYWKDETKNTRNSNLPYHVVQSQPELCSWIKEFGDSYDVIYCTGCMPLYIKSVFNLRSL